MQITVRATYDGAIAKLRMARAQSQKALVRALNKTATTAKAEAARQIRDAGYGLKIAAIKDSFSIRRASKASLVAAIRATGRPVPLIKYGARQTKKGVSVNVLQGRKLIAGAFIATMPSGHIGVFMRQGGTHKRVVRNGLAMWSGLPIKELFGPSVPAAFANKVVMAALKSVIQERFAVVLTQELRYEGLKH